MSCDVKDTAQLILCMLCIKGVPILQKNMNSQPKKKSLVACFCIFDICRRILLDTKKKVTVTAESASAMLGQKSGSLGIF